MQIRSPSRPLFGSQGSRAPSYGLFFYMKRLVLVMLGMIAFTAITWSFYRVQSQFSPKSIDDPALSSRRPTLAVDIPTNENVYDGKNDILSMSASAASGSNPQKSLEVRVESRSDSSQKSDIPRRSEPFLRRLFSTTSSSDDSHTDMFDHDSSGGINSGIRSDSEESKFPKVLILTPMKNSQKHMSRYFSLLRNLTYPASRLSIGILDSDSDETHKGVKTIKALLDQGYTDADIEAMSGTLASVLVHLPSLEKKGWSRATVVQHNFGYSLPRNLRHGKEAQLERRTSLARSRNHLLTSALHEDDTFCLWIDSDLVSYPQDVIERLLSAKRDIVVPNVVMSPGGRSYDLNSWRSKHSPGDNATSDDVVKYFNALRKKKASFVESLELEGYGETNNFYLHHLRKGGKGVTGVKVREEEEEEEEQVVRLDAVGGAMLLVRAELHRHGLVFPPFVYRGRIETEGLSMMAVDMGTMSFGMPNLEVIHH